jgi:hypothetical protein
VGDDAYWGVGDGEAEGVNCGWGAGGVVVWVDADCVGDGEGVEGG